MTIEWVDIETLNPHPKNPNRHSSEQIERLVKLIDFQGWRHPIIVSERSGLIVAGHGRLEAAKKLQLKRVPVHYQEFLSDEQEYAFLVSDNSIASWAELDLGNINIELATLGPDFDIDLLGIKDFVLEPADKGGLTDEDSIPNVPVDAVVKRGDLYLLDSHRLLCGDSTVSDSVSYLMNGEKADMVFTSPPYNAGDLDFQRGMNGKKYLSDNDMKEDYPQFLSDFLSAWLPHANFIWVNLQLLSRIRVDVVEWLFKWKENIVDAVVWMKTNPPPSAHNNVLNHGFEMLYIFSVKPNGRVSGVFPKGSISNTYLSAVNSNREFSGIHHAGFPISFVENWIQSAPSTVADSFLGTGSTLIACEKTNRKCFGMEIDPHYCDVIIERWQKYTGKQAIREDGILWQDLKNQLTLNS